MNFAILTCIGIGLEVLVKQGSRDQADSHIVTNGKNPPECQKQ